jgi:hypothetical protein
MTLLTPPMIMSPENIVLLVLFEKDRAAADPQPSFAAVSQKLDPSLCSDSPSQLTSS